MDPILLPDSSPMSFMPLNKVMPIVTTATNSSTVTPSHRAFVMFPSIFSSSSIHAPDFPGC